MAWWVWVLIAAGAIAFGVLKTTVAKRWLEKRKKDRETEEEEG